MAEEASTSAPPAAQDEVVAKYKKLLSMARSSLETNQAALALKDQQIAQLASALNEERMKKAKPLPATQHRDDDAQFPRRILCRVDVQGVIWLLLEYEALDDDWKSFTDEQALKDFIQRTPGMPLVCPQKCLSVEESTRLVEESKRRVEKTLEEFRKYKVRMEIALKQKDAEIKPLASNLSLSSAALPSALERALTAGEQKAQDETDRLRIALADQEQKWRSLCEKLAKENESLRRSGAESVLAQQWRARYESCVKDRDDLLQKLALYSQLSDELSTSGKSLEDTYLDLLDDFKALRRKLHALLQEHGADADDHERLRDLIHALKDCLQRFAVDLYEDHSTVRSAASPAADSSSGGKGNLAESKVQYLRQIVFQYLVCREPDVKTRIEMALSAIFRFTPEEKSQLEEARREENPDTLSSLSTFLGALTG